MQVNLDSAQYSDYTNQVGELDMGTQSTDGPTGAKESEWMNDKWTTYWKYFNSNPELKSALILKSIWNVGKGYACDDSEDELVLEHIKGPGKSTFRDILFNMDLIKNLGGNSYSEIIRSKETGQLLNLKPLDPGSMKHVYGSDGMLIRYEQVNKVAEGKQTIIKFQPKDIFHLQNNYLADQMHGISDIVALEETIKAENENFADIKKVMHHQAVPMILWKLKTDDEPTIKAFIQKVNETKKYGEDLFIPDDQNILSWEIVQVNVPQAIFEWRNDIRNKFYRSIGIPQIVPGAGGQSTESESKVIYLAFEQIVEHNQAYIEEQVWSQLGIKIDLVPPASLAQDLQRDQAKDGPMSMQQSEMMPGVNE